VQLAHWILLAFSIVLLIWALARWRGTPEFHPEYSVRRDTALLMLLLLAGVIGDAARTRFPDVSIPYLAISLGLTPVAIGGVVLLIRLIKAYRQSQETSSGAGDAHAGARDRRE
jgi:hypothetical protein